ncbi:hypothetical protein DNH61_24175 [Paenibacillus sambharensis]|uniref:HTH LytTR-type domain-containing protein n=1 Tax=Paenibacillus sambharensis TaxID=1803190 RepID=A0A2W1L2M2_9BACL|nr:LytTR family transcriptional regulator DNA-binding domain-containing protein [Paenibacillus sambharensis]PZD93149.1 hypothetical protein DNH61_24175 [Paenibacillus sambharensis]
MLLSLTHDIDGKSGFVHVEADDLLYISFDSMTNRVSFHTSDHEYFAMGTLKYFIETFLHSGYVFEKVDRNNAVNMQKVTLVDEKMGLVYFDTMPGRRAKKCTVAVSNFKNILLKLKSSNPDIAVLR